MTLISAAARVLLLLFAWACAASASAQPRFDFDATPGRLSKDVLPTRYALELDLDPARDHFGGEASITVRVRRAVAVIVVHANGLDVSRAALVTANGGPSRALSLAADAAAQTLTLTPADGAPVAAGEHRIELAWRGKVQQSGQALYRAESRQGGRTLPIGFLDTALAGTPAQARLRAAGRALFAPQLAALGWSPRPGDSAETLKLRGTLIEQLARFEDARVIARTRQLFDDDEAKRAALPASMRSSVITAVGVHADRARFDRLLARLKSAGSEEDRELYLGALAAGRDAARAKTLLALALTGVVAPNTASSIPQQVGASSPFGDLAYRFTLEHWPRLAEMAGNNFGASGWLLPGAAWSFNDADRVAAMLDDQRRVAGADGATPVARAADRIELLAAVKRRDARELEKLLDGWKPVP